MPYVEVIYDIDFFFWFLNFEFCNINNAFCKIDTTVDELNLNRILIFKKI